MTESQLLPFNFGGIAETRYADFDAARILVWPIPYEGTVSYGHGTGDGPRAIINASRNMELYDEEINNSVYRLGIHTLPELGIADHPAAMMAKIEQEAHKLFATGKFLTTLGGEHSITGPIVRAVAKQVRDLSVLQIDAHTDLRETYDGTPHSHTSIMARVVEVCPVVQVGIRSISEVEAKRLPTIRSVVFWARDIVGRTDWYEDAISHLTQNVYLTIDIDGFDPSLVPSTGAPEPGGLGWYDVIGIVRATACARNIVGMDLTELAPIPQNIAPDFLAAKLVYKCLGYIFQDEIGRPAGES